MKKQDEAEKYFQYLLYSICHIASSCVINTHNSYSADMVFDSRQGEGYSDLCLSWFISGPEAHFKLVTTALFQNLSKQASTIKKPYNLCSLNSVV